MFSLLNEFRKRFEKLGKNNYCLIDAALKTLLKKNPNFLSHIRGHQTTGFVILHDTILFSKEENVAKSSETRVYHHFYIFSIWNIIFRSYDLFGTRNRYHSISRSLHLWFRTSLEIRKNVDFKKIYFF